MLGSDGQCWRTLLEQKWKMAIEPDGLVPSSAPFYASVARLFRNRQTLTSLHGVRVVSPGLFQALRMSGAVPSMWCSRMEFAQPWCGTLARCRHSTANPGGTVSNHTSTAVTYVALQTSSILRRFRARTLASQALNEVSIVPWIGLFYSRRAKLDK